MLIEIPCRKCESVVFDAVLPDDLDGNVKEATLMVAKALHVEHTLFRSDITIKDQMFVYDPGFQGSYVSNLKELD